MIDHQLVWRTLVLTVSVLWVALRRCGIWGWVLKEEHDEVVSIREEQGEAVSGWGF